MSEREPRPEEQPHRQAELRREGARQFVWVTLRDARRSVIPPDALAQHDRYARYFPYVNERLRRLDRRRADLVLAPWDRVSNRRRPYVRRDPPEPGGRSAD